MRQDTRVREGRLERDGVGLRYLEWPAGDEKEPAILLIHGLSSNALIWKRLAPLLAGRRVVALDQRSHGRSDSPATGYGNEQLAADVAFAISELGLVRPVVAGHSWGALIALELAATWPDLVGGLAVVDGPIAPMSMFMTWDEAATRMQPPLPVYKGLDEAAGAVRDYLRDAWDGDLADFVEAGLVEEGGAWRSTLTAPVRLEILKAMFGAQPELLLPRVEGPILVAAAGDFRDWRERQVAMATEIRPDAVVHWYDSAHDIPLIRPAELAVDLDRLAYRAAYREVERDLDGLDGDWSRPAQGDGAGWSAKDLLAHLASTQAALPRIFSTSVEPRAAVKDGAAPFDSARWNASQVGRRMEATPESLEQEIRAATDALDPVLAEADLQSVTQAGPFAGRPLAETLELMLAHQRTHAAELRRALQS